MLGLILKVVAMKLQVLTIPPEGIEISAESGEDRWFSEAVAEALPEPNSLAWLELHVTRNRTEVSAFGQMGVEFRPRCDRCTEPFAGELFVPIHQVYLPTTHPAKKERALRETKDELTASADDQDCSFYRKNTINLKDLVRELIVLAQPIRFLCHEACLGLCEQCGVNLNDQACRCAPSQSSSPFAALAALK